MHTSVSEARSRPEHQVNLSNGPFTTAFPFAQRLLPLLIISAEALFTVVLLPVVLVDAQEPVLDTQLCIAERSSAIDVLSRV